MAQFLHRSLLEGHLHAALQKSWTWLDVNIFDLGRQMRVSYLPPLMVYMAAGISGLTAIVGTFFVKDYLGLSAEFLAMLGFWAGIPWAFKMPWPHRRSGVALEVPAGLFGRGAHRGEPGDYAGLAQCPVVHGAVHERRGLVRAERPVVAAWLCRPGRRR